MVWTARLDTVDDIGWYKPCTSTPAAPAKHRLRKVCSALMYWLSYNFCSSEIVYSSCKTCNSNCFTPQKQHFVYWALSRCLGRSLHAFDAPRISRDSNPCKTVPIPYQQPQVLVLCLLELSVKKPPKMRCLMA